MDQKTAWSRWGVRLTCLGITLFAALAPGLSRQEIEGILDF